MCKLIKTSFFVDKKYFIIFLCLLMLFILILNLNLYTHIMHDEYVFSRIYGTEQKTESIGDIFVSLKTLYNLHTGRVIVHFFIQLFCMIDLNIFKVINSVIYVLFVYMIYKFSKVKNDNWLNILFLFFICTMTFVKIPVFGQTVIWLSGSINYLWVATLLLVNVYCFYSMIKNHKYEVSLTKRILLYIISFVLGASHETVAIMNIVCMFFFNIYILMNTKKNKQIMVNMFHIFFSWLCFFDDSTW